MADQLSLIGDIRMHPHCAAGSYEFLQPFSLGEASLPVVTRMFCSLPSPLQYVDDKGCQGYALHSVAVRGSTSLTGTSPKLISIDEFN